jgi:hypothetical protein
MLRAASRTLLSPSCRAVVVEAAATQQVGVRPCCRNRSARRQAVRRYCYYTALQLNLASPSPMPGCGSSTPALGPGAGLRAPVGAPVQREPLRCTAAAATWWRGICERSSRAAAAGGGGRAAAAVIVR